MNTNPTIEKLKKMRLSAMAELHYNHIKDNRVEAHTLMPTWHYSQITNGKIGKTEK